MYLKNAFKKTKSFEKKRKVSKKNEKFRIKTKITEKKRKKAKKNEDHYI